MANVKISGTDKLDDLTFYSLFNILQAGMWLKNDIEKFLRPYGLSHGRFSIMLAIIENGYSSMIHNDISLSLGRSKPTISKMLASLERDGLVECFESDTDGRSRQYRLTDKAASLLEDIIPKYNRRLLKISRNLGKEDMIEIMTILSRLDYPEHGHKIHVCTL